MTCHAEARLIRGGREMRTQKGADLSGLSVAQNQHVSLCPVVDLVDRPFLGDSDLVALRVLVGRDELPIIPALRLLQSEDSLKVHVDDLGSRGPAGFGAGLIHSCHTRSFPAERLRIFVE
jgi:hypothetical protein